MGRLENKIALVTGGGAGIGAAICEALAAEGARVLVADIREAEAASQAAKLGSQGQGLKLDVRSEDDWSAAAAACSRMGGLDILVNNAGVAARLRQNPETVTVEEWEFVQAVNTVGVVLGCKHAIPLLKQRGGSIVNVASVGGLSESPLAYAYGASKAAVLQITKTVALYCARKRYGVRCNAVLPGIIATGLYEQATPRDRQDAEAEAIPLGCLGAPEDVAHCVAFLAGDEARFVTGAHFVVDGGASAANPLIMAMLPRKQ